MKNRQRKKSKYLWGPWLNWIVWQQLLQLLRMTARSALLVPSRWPQSIRSGETKPSAASIAPMDFALTIIFISEMYRMKQSALSWTSLLPPSTLVSLSPSLKISPKVHGHFSLMNAAIKLWFALTNGQATNSSTDLTQIASALSTLVMASRILRSTSSSSEAPSIIFKKNWRKLRH